MTDPEIASREPFGIEVEQGKKYWWCRCGRSANQPFCDGSHRGTDIEPMEYTAQRTGTAWFCGCKRTGNEPMCDGSHNKLD